MDDIKSVLTTGEIGQLGKHSFLDFLWEWYFHITLAGPMPTNFAEMFTMYALYKQVTVPRETPSNPYHFKATIGQCNTNKPFWNIVERYKWFAKNSEN